MSTGVYAIRNKINGKLYVGSAAVSLYQRFHSHKSSLRWNRHHSAHLQASWNKYGEAAFEFYVIQECSPDCCVILEQYWIDQYRACDPNFGYNNAPTAGSTLGFKYSDESRAKISKALIGKTKGIKKTKEHSQNISAALRGKKRTKNRPDIKTGDKFQFWTVVREIEGTRQYVCECKCGRERLVFEQNLLTGRSSMCRSCSNRQRG